MIYSTNYFNYEQTRAQAVPIKVITDKTHPIPLDDPRLETAWWDRTAGQGGSRQHTEDKSPHWGRLAGVWWKCHPDLVLPDEPVTIWIGGNFDILVSDFAERCLDELGDDDVLLMRHPWRDDLVDEEAESHPNPKYDGQDTAGQIASYMAAGHPRMFGLAHGGFLVRRNVERVQRFNDAWWAEITRWSISDQLSLPYVMANSGLRWHWWPAEGTWRSRPFAEGWLRYGQIGE